MNKEVSCPLCGSTNVIEHKLEQNFNLTLFNGPKKIILSNYICNECHEEGDFENKNDELISITTKELQKDFVKESLEMLDKKTSLVGIERALELPFRTLNRWKSGDFSASSVALLRILRTYPWVINVADEKFSNKAASYYLVKEASSLLSQTLISSDLTMDVKINSTPSNVTATINLSKPSSHSGLSFQGMGPKKVVGV